MSGMDDPDRFFDEISQHLSEDQFRRRVMLFQRSDNVLRPLLENLEALDPHDNIETRQQYLVFLQAADTILEGMKPFLPEKTFLTLNGRLASYRQQLAERPSSTDS